MLSLDCGGGGCDGGAVSEELIFETTYPLGGTTAIGLPSAPEARVFKFTFEGQYEAWFPPPPPPDTGGPRFFTNADARGFLLSFRCHAALSTWYFSPGSFGPGICWSPPPGTLPSITVIQRVKGEGILSGSGSDMLLIGPPYQVKVHRLETPIRLRRLNPPSTPPVGQAGVLAEVIPAPYWVGGFRMPMRVLSWTWTPTQAGVTPEMVFDAGTCGTGFTEFWIFCSFTARESGTLTVRASVNGGPEQEASITVNVLDCLGVDSAGVPDTLLNDDPLLRQGLRNLWDASKPTANRNDRLEQLGSVVCGPQGCLVTPIVPTDVGPCHVNGPMDPEADFNTHIHPFLPLPEGGDPLPRTISRCKTLDEDLKPGQDAYSYPGPSKGVLGDMARVANSGKGLMTVDGEGVYWTPFTPKPDGATDQEWVDHLKDQTSRIADRRSCDPLRH